MRKVLAKTKSAGKVSEALRGLQIEGGPAGMMRVLYEVGPPAADWWLVVIWDDEGAVRGGCPCHRLVVGGHVCHDCSQVCGCSAVESVLLARRQFCMRCS